MSTQPTNEEMGDSSLERSLNAPMLAIYGAGTILGAGIYVVIGKVAQGASYWTPLAFLIAAGIASINGLIYAELSTRSPNAGGPSDYVDKAFSTHWFTALIGWMIVATGVISAATISTGFSGYVAYFFGLPEMLSRTALLLALGAVAAWGAEESAWFMILTTTMGVLGLLYVMYIGFAGAGAMSFHEYMGKLPSLGDTAVWMGLASSVFLATYSFIGFEDMVHMAEEVHNPSSSLPKAIVAALLIATVLYALVSLAVLKVVTPEALGQSKAPLAKVASTAGYPEWPLGVFGTLIVLNGALAQIIMATRVIYSFRVRDAAPTWLTKVNDKTKTPLRATILVTLAILVLALFVPLKWLASATSFVMLLIFFASNIALIVLERREPEAPFDVPVFLPYIGAALTLVLLACSFFLTGGH